MAERLNTDAPDIIDAFENAKFRRQKAVQAAEYLTKMMNAWLNSLPREFDAYNKANMISRIKAMNEHFIEIHNNAQEEESSLRRKLERLLQEKV